MANENLGANFSIDISDLKTGLAQANRLIRESESQFREAAAGMDDWSASQEGLTARVQSFTDQIGIQQKKVDALTAEKERMIAAMRAEGKSNEEIARAVDTVNKQITRESKELDRLKGELGKSEQALADFNGANEEAGDGAEDTAGKFEGMKGAAGVAAGAVAAVAAAAVAAVGAFLGLAEATRESRTQMGKLETAYAQAGLSAQAAENTFTELYGILGDEGTATEAAQQLAQIADDEEELAAQTRILTGVFATYGDSINSASLAEGIASTVAMSEVQGTLADALEWQGVNLDDFNARLAACADEEERSALITETLTGLYGDAADQYKEVNADVIAAQEAQAGLQQAMNDLGAIAEPIMTTLKTLATDLLVTIMPFVELIGEGLTGALSGSAGAAESLASGINGLITTALDTVVSAAPFVIDTLLSIIPTLLTEILSQLPNILQTLLSMISQIALSLSKMLPTLIPVVISTIVMLVETLLDNIDMLIDSGIALLLGLADGLIAALPDLIAKIPVILDKLISAITNNLPKLIEAGIRLTVSLARGLIQAIPQLVSQIPQILRSITSGLREGLSSVKEIGKDLIRGLWNGISDMVGWIGKKIKGFGESVLSGLKNFFGIHSPSTLVEDEVGENVGLAVGTGAVKALPKVNRMLRNAFGELSLPSIGMNVQNGSGGLASGNTGSVNVYQTNNYSQAHSRIEIYRSKQATAAAVRLALGGA